MGKVFDRVVCQPITFRRQKGVPHPHHRHVSTPPSSFPDLAVAGVFSRHGLGRQLVSLLPVSGQTYYHPLIPEYMLVTSSTHHGFPSLGFDSHHRSMTPGTNNKLVQLSSMSNVKYTLPPAPPGNGTSWTLTRPPVCSGDQLSLHSRLGECYNDSFRVVGN